MLVKGVKGDGGNFFNHLEIVKGDGGKYFSITWTYLIWPADNQRVSKRERREFFLITWTYLILAY